MAVLSARRLLVGLVAALATSCSEALCVGCQPMPRLRSRARCQMMADLPLSEKSSLAEYAARVFPALLRVRCARAMLTSCSCVRRGRRMRAFVKDQGLDVKTSGKGRTKATILADLQALWSGGTPLAAPAVEAEAAAAAGVAMANEAAAEADIEAKNVRVEAAAAAAAAVAAEESAEAEAEATAAAAAAQPAAAAAQPAAAAEDEPAGAAPNGFEWGGTF